MRSPANKVSPAPKSGPVDMIRMRAWKLDSANTSGNNSGSTSPSADAPRLHLDTVEPGLNMSQYDNWFKSDRIASGASAGIRSPSSGSRPPIIHKAASINGISSRNASDAASHPNPIIEELTSPTYQNPAAERSEKTSRFIAQLQEKLTRISREVAFHEATSKELEKENQLLRTQIEDGRSRLGTLEQVHEADLHSLDAQDRKIKRLKAELEEEKSRRIKAEVASQSAVVNAADTVQKANRDVVRAQELATYATSSYETLQKAFDKEKQRNLSEEKKMKENIAAISSAFRERIESISRVERKRTLDLERLDAVIAAKDEVIRQYESNSRKQSDAFAAYRDERDGEIRELRESARDKIQESEDVLESLKEIRGRMKWIISVKRDVKGAG